MLLIIKKALGDATVDLEPLKNIQKSERIISLAFLITLGTHKKLSLLLSIIQTCILFDVFLFHIFPLKKQHQNEKKKIIKNKNNSNFLFKYVRPRFRLSQSWGALHKVEESPVN